MGDIASIVSLSYTLLFVACLLICGLIGLIRGLRKSVYSIISYAIMLVVFWIISMPIASGLMNMNLSQALSQTEFSSCKTISEVLKEVVVKLESNSNGQLTGLSSNEVVLGALNSMTYMLTRIIVLIILFIVGYLIWSFISWILWLTIFRGKKEVRQARKKKHLLGGAVGLGKGILTFLVLILPFSGFLSVFVEGVTAYDNINSAESTTEPSSTTNSDTTGVKNKPTLASVGYVPMSLSSGDDSLEEITKVAKALKGNFVFQATTAIDSPFFDNVVSCKIGAGKSRYSITLRKELINLANLGTYASKNILGEDENGQMTYNLTNESVNKVFSYVSKSEIIAVAIPLGLDIGLNLDSVKEKIGTLGEDYDLTIEDIYNINWKKELKGYGTALANGISAVGDVSKLTTEGSIDFESVLFDLDTASVKAMFTSLSELESVTKVIPVGVEYALKQDSFKEYLPENFSFEYGDTSSSDWWKAEIANLGSIYEGFKNLGITELPKTGATEESKGELDIPKLLGELTQDDEKLSGFVGTIVESRLVTKLLPIGFDYGMDAIDKSTNNEGESYKSLFNYTDMTKDEWKSDFVSLIKAADSLYSSKVMDLGKEGTDVTYSTLNYEALDSCVTKLLTLNVISGNQGKLFTKLISIVSTDDLPLSTEDLDFEQVEDWGAEGSALVGTVKAASPILENMDSLSIDTINTTALGNAIDKATDSHIAVQLLPGLIEKVMNRSGINSTLGIEGEYVLPSITDWKKEGSSLVGVLKAIQGKSDITIAIIKLSPDTLLGSKLITDLAVKAISVLNTKEGMDMLVIPYTSTSTEWYDSYSGTTRTDGELRKVLLGLQPLIEGKDSLDDLSSSLSIQTITKLTETNIDNLFNSEIIYLSSSKLLTDQIGSESSLVIPSTAKEDGNIKRNELKLLLKEAKRMEIVDDNGNVKTDPGVINKVGTQTFTSDILCATISKVLLETTEIKIPSSVKTVLGDTNIIERTELDKLVSNCKAIEIVKEDGTITADTSLINHTGLNKALVAGDSFSLILQATISDILLTNDSLSIPSNVKEAIGDLDAITKLELGNLIDNCKTLGVVGADGAITADAKLLKKDGLNKDLITGEGFSRILHTTMSDALIKNDSIKVPSNQKEELGGFTVIKVNELGCLVDNIKALDVVDDNGNVESDVTIVNNPSLNKAFINNTNFSVILQATISDSLLTNDSLSIPSDVKEVIGDLNAITKLELGNLIDNCKTLGVVGADGAITANAKLLKKDGLNKDLITGEGFSRILHTTMSDALIKNDSIEIPSTEKEELGGFTVVKKEELGRLVDNTKTLDVVDDDGAVDCGVTVVNNPKLDYEFINSEDFSLILQATISKTLIENADMIIPSQVQEAMGNKTVVIKGELAQLITDVKTLDIVSSTGEINASIGKITGDSFDDEFVTAMSLILQATLSKKILDVTDLTIPKEAHDNAIETLDTFGNKVLTKTEIKNLKVGIKTLDIVSNDEVDTQKMNIGLLNKVDADTLASKILQATISDKIYASQTEAIVITENEKDSSVTYIKSSLDVKAITAYEILHLKEAIGPSCLGILNNEDTTIDFNLIGVGLIDTMASETFRWDLAIGTEANYGETLYDGSRIIHHSISKMITDDLEATPRAYYDFDLRNDIMIDEIKAVIKDVKQLDLVSGDQIVTPGLSIITKISDFTQEETNTLISSKIIHTIISDNVFGSGTFASPKTSATSTKVEVNGYDTLGATISKIEFLITSEELLNLSKSITSLNFLEGDSFKTLDASVINLFRQTSNSNEVNTPLVNDVFKSYLIRYEFGLMLVKEELLYIPEICYLGSSEETVETDFTLAMRKDLESENYFYFVKMDEVRNLLNAIIKLDMLDESDGTTKISLISFDDIVGLDSGAPIAEYLSSDILRVYVSHSLKEDNPAKYALVSPFVSIETENLYLLSYTTEIKASTLPSNFITKTSLVEAITYYRTIL